MNLVRPSGRGNATKRYCIPVTHKAFSPIFVKYHLHFPCNPFEEVSHPYEVQQLTRSQFKSPSRPERFISYASFIAPKVPFKSPSRPKRLISN